MLEKISTLWPALFLLMGAVSCLVVGLHPQRSTRQWTPWTAGLAILAALIATPFSARATTLHPLGMHGLQTFVTVMALVLGGVLLVLNSGVPERLRQLRDAEQAPTFEPGNAHRGEFYAFFLMSLAGVLLVAAATDLVWLFLALELSSLPTYVMIALSRNHGRGHESAIKYFFLGALSAAVFLYGFALIYAATGFTELGGIAAYAAGAASVNLPPLLIAGIVLAVLGLAFKIAAVPCHVYAADVYDGAATPVTAYLAVMPKIAGFTGLILVLGTIGWPLPQAVVALLAVMAVLTMTLGNLLAFVQTRLKRVMAYSGIAQSGYILLGVLVGPYAAATVSSGADAGNNGIAASLFYLFGYGLATAAALGVIAAAGSPAHAGQADADNEHEEPTYESLAGLSHRRPVLAAGLVVAMLSLTGVPLLVGFIGKVCLAGPENAAGYWALVVALVINSAVSAGYYLRIAAAAYLGVPRTRPTASGGRIPHPLPPHSLARWVAVVGCVAAVVALGTFLAEPMIQAAHRATVPVVELELDTLAQSPAPAFQP